MHKEPYIFAQLVKFIDRSKFNRIVTKYEGDKYIKSYTCWNQLLTMKFGQLSNRESLRDLIVAMEAHAGKLYHLGIGKSVTRSNLSKANEQRNYRIFEEYATFMISEACKRRINKIFELDCLEYKEMNYILACRFNNRIKYSLTHEKVWIELADGLEISETTYQANSWDKPRRIVMVRQEIEKRPNAAGKQVRQLELFENGNDFGRYRYSCLVTNLRLPARIVYDSYRGRADSENRIKELKYDFSIDDFVTNNFWATEACGNFIVMAYNFMSLFRHALINSDKKQFLKTIRYELISTPAYLGRTKDKHILYLARSLKTRQAFLAIWEKIKDFSLPYDTEKS